MHLGKILVKLLIVPTCSWAFRAAIQNMAKDVEVFGRDIQVTATSNGPSMGRASAQLAETSESSAMPALVAKEQFSTAEEMLVGVGARCRFKSFFGDACKPLRVVGIVAVCMIAAIGISFAISRHVLRQRLAQADKATWSTGRWVDPDEMGSVTSLDTNEQMEGELDFMYQATLAKTCAMSPGDGLGDVWSPVPIMHERTEETEPRAEEKPSILSRLFDAAIFLAALVGFVMLNVGDLTLRELSKAASPSGKMEFAIPTVICVSSIASVTTGHIVTAYNEGLNGVRRSWNPKLLLQLTLASLFFNFESMGRFYAINLGLSSDTCMVISRLGLVTIAILMALLLHRKQNIVQSMLLVVMTCSVILFARQKAALKNEAVEASTQQSRMLLGALAAAGAMLCGVTAETSTTLVILHNDEMPVWIMKTAMDLPGMVFLIITCAVDPAVRTNGFFHGWNFWCPFIALCFLGKMWCSFMIVKLLGPVVKQVASVSALVLQYVVCMLLFPGKPENKFNSNVLLSIFLVAGVVTCYAIETRERQKRKALKNK